MYQMVTKNFYCIFGPILVILGSIGAVLCLCVFGQKSMRKNTGSIYFIAFNIGNILLLWVGLVPFVYVYMTGFDLTLINLIYCRLRIYLLNIFIILPSSYLILASIDRTLITSRNALTRQRSTHRLAVWSICGITLLWSLYYFRIWFLVGIQSIGPEMFLCFFKFGIYFMLMSYSTMTVTGFVPPILMAIFGLMTMRNFRQLRIHPRSNEQSITQIPSRDRQLAVMLLFQIIISIFFSLVGSIIYVYTQRVSNEDKAIDQQALDYFLLNLSVILLFVQAAITSSSNFIVSKTFRKNLQKCFSKVTPFACRRNLITIGSNIPTNFLAITNAVRTINVHATAKHE